MKYPIRSRCAMAPSPNAHGHHVYVDYIGYEPQVGDAGPWLLALMQRAVEDAGVEMVFSHVEHFDGSRSPAGFAAIILLDESHVSAHCYSDRGWLAIDAFTCGLSDPGLIIDSIHTALSHACPQLRLMKREQVDRFLHQGL